MNLVLEETKERKLTLSFLRPFPSPSKQTELELERNNPKEDESFSQVFPTQAVNKKKETM